MKFLLDAIGGLFVYRSPEPLDGFRRYLRHVTNYELRKHAGTKHNYNKTMLINMICDEINGYKSTDS